MNRFLTLLFVALFALSPMAVDAKTVQPPKKQVQKTATPKNKKTVKKAKAVAKPAAKSVAKSSAVKPAVQPVALRPPETPALPPSEVIASFYRTLESVMKEGDALGFQGRAEKLEAAVAKTFSARDMTRVSYGPSWVKASPEQQDKLTQAFHHFTVANYASQFKKFDGEEFTVIGEKPGQSEGQRIVETTLKSGKETHQLNYLMVKNDRGWQITDVFVDGAISEMATRRSEFGSVIRASGADGLLNVLTQKSKQMAE